MDASGLRPIPCISLCRALEVIPTQSEAAALSLEASLIREYRPPYNILLKDDRRYPYVVLTGSDFPRLLVTRSRGSHAPRRERNMRRYGPFVDEGRIKRTVAAIHRAYPLRQRAKPLHADRPCLNYDMGTCPGPCQALITRDLYAETIRQVDMLLTGRIDEVLGELSIAMKRFVEKRQYEDAAILRDRRDILTEAFLACDEESPSLADEAAAAASVSDPARAASSRDVAAVHVANAGNGRLLAKVAVLQSRAGSVIARYVYTAASSELSSHTNFRYNAENEKAVGSTSVAGDLGADSDSADDFAAEVLNASLAEHYGRAENPMEIPAEVVLANPLRTSADKKLLADALATKRGKAVSVVAVRSATRRLADIALRNARVEADIDVSRTLNFRSEMESLVCLLDDLVPQECTSVHRIECFDISHTHGSNAVGAMSVLLDGVPAPSEYRRFFIDDADSSLGRPDDYASMEAALLQRFRGLSALSTIRPDLIVIDGGKGQLSAAGKAMADLARDGSAVIAPGIPMVALAKRAEEVFAPHCETALNADIGITPGVHLLCRARDEAHAFAVQSHRQVRGAAALRSGLDGIPGIGASKRAALLSFFPTGAAGVAAADIETLARVAGIGPALARRIHLYFQRGDGSTRV